MKEHMKRHFFLFLTFLGGCLVFLAAYGLCRLIFRRLGTPPPWLAFLIPVLLGVLFCLILASLWTGKKGHFHQSFYTQIYEVIDAITRGDFNVFVDDSDIRNHHSFVDLAKRVNNMAAQLGSMETMRRDFISNVSHELQTPLTSIKGFAVLLKKEELDREEQLRYIQVIEDESRRLSKLSDNLLRLSALDAGTATLQPAAYPLDRQIRDVILTLEPQWAAKDIRFRLDLPSMPVELDRDLMDQVWLNLLGNAVKFSPQGGEIRVSARGNGERLQAEIQDQGPGIGEEHLPHIFDRFYMADRSRKRDLGGNGLGLSIVKNIVELHGGEVTASGASGEGSLFTVSLPTKKSPV